MGWVLADGSHEGWAAAKASGATWADIGTAVGITRQTAHERWSSQELDHNDAGGPNS